MTDLRKGLLAWRRVPWRVALAFAKALSERVLFLGAGGYGPEFLLRVASGALVAAARGKVPSRRRGECPYCGVHVSRGKDAVTVHDGTGSAGHHGKGKLWHWRCYGEFSTHEFFDHPGRR